MNGDAIKKIVIDYLRKPETDYAIMINGDWGCGKTHFVCSILKDEIEKTLCPQHTPKKNGKCTQKKANYQWVYYSLFGISSSEELSIGVKKQLILNNTKEREAQKKDREKPMTVAETAVGVFSDILGVDSKRLLNLYSLIDIPNNAVLIFDDLERSKMPLAEILGIINKYAVVDKRKVIVICNEIKIDKEFCDFKEKTIRYTLGYTPTQEEIFKSIIDSKNDFSDKYRLYIEENIHLFIDIFYKGGCKNLRTFIFVLDVFESVYSTVKHHDYYFNEEFLRGLLIFTCIYSIEFKNNTPIDKLLWFADFSTEYGASTFLSLSGRIPKKDNEENFILHISRYGETCLRDMIGSKALAEYIQYGDLNVNELGKELNREEKRYITLQKTAYGKTLKQMMNWSLIEDGEINDVLDNVERFLQEDKYSVPEISTLYARFLTLKYNNIKCRDIDSNIFFEAVDRRKSSWTPIRAYDGNDLIYQWHDRGYPFDEQYKALYNYIIKIDKNIEHCCKSKRSVELLDKIKGGDLNSLKQYIKTMEQKQWFIQDPDELWLALQNSDTAIQQFIIEELKNATDKEEYKPYELTFIKKLCIHFKPLFTGDVIDFGLIKYKDIATRLNKIQQRYCVQETSPKKG